MTLLSRPFNLRAIPQPLPMVTYDETALTSVEILTEERRIVGQVAKGRMRVSDIFNQDDRPYVQLHNASFTSLWRKSEPQMTDDLLVNTNIIVLVIPREDPGAAISAAQAERQMVWITKHRHAVVLEVPPFAIFGDVHLVPYSNVRDILMNGHPQFIPVTNAKAVAIDKGPDPFSAETILVNRQFIHYAYKMGNAESGSATGRTLLKTYS